MEWQNEKDAEIKNEGKMIINGMEEEIITALEQADDHLKDLVTQYQLQKDLLTQYQLYGYNDHLATPLKEKLGGQEEKDADLSTSPRSIFYSGHSSEGKSCEDGKCGNGLQKLDGSFKQEPEAVNGLVVDQKQKLKDANGEKEALRGGMHKPLSSVDEGWKRSLEDLETVSDQLKDENTKSWLENFTAANLFWGLNSAQEEKMPLISINAEISDTMEQKQGILHKLIEEDQQLSERFNENEAEHSEEATSGSSEYEEIEKLRLEKCHLKAQVADLELEVSSLLTQKGKLEAQIKKNSHEARYLREENQLLQLMTRELHDRHISSERLYEISSLLKKLEEKYNKGSAQIMALTALDKVMQDLDNSHSQKIPLALEVAGERQEAAGRQTKENKNIEFTGLLSDMQNFLREHEDEICKLTIEYKQLEDLNQKSLSNSQEVDKKIRHTEENEMIGIITRASEKEKKRGEYGKQIKAELKLSLKK